jgi:2-amino-4-hydroxy-6-hydroxymethyldihydropteridine diphosphokinase
VTPAYIALGSNLGDPAAQLKAAVAALARLPQSRLERLSRVYRSAAVGPGTQPDYLNAAALLLTALPPLPLLRALQAIEARQGRVRCERWGARTLDLDLLLYDDLALDTPELQVPHPRMARRNFVLYPLLDIGGPNLRLPDGTDLGTLVLDCPRGELEMTCLELLQ